VTEEACAGAVATLAAAPRDERSGFGRWVAANVGVAIPLSMAPITFGLATLSQGDVNGGALMVAAMTGAEVLGAVPIAATGRRFSATGFARLLAAVRAVAFVGLALALAADASLVVLVAGALLGCGALLELDRTHGEVKSMRTPEARRRTGAGRALLMHIIDVARSRGYERLSLETGSVAAFTPAHRLYESAGFTRTGPFGAYIEDPNSVFMTLRLAPPAVHDEQN